jgi:hypothetical protein
MDCEKFESAMMDELYGELDELTSAAAKRHVTGCARCAARIAGLRATRRVAVLPLAALATPPPGFEERLEQRILAAAGEAARVVPLRRRVARIISVAGNWAMRPQTAMAAVFLVMVGTSVLLLRGKSARAPARAPVTVTEQGSPAPPVLLEPSAPAASLAPVESLAAASPTFSVPAGQRETASASAPGRAGALAPTHAEPADEARRFAARPLLPAAQLAPPPSPAPARYDEVAANAAAAPMGPPAAGAAAGGAAAAPVAPGVVSSPFEAALARYRAGKYGEAMRAFDALAPGDAVAELWAARSAREGSGCRAALARFDHVAQRAAGSPPGWDALLGGALCFRALGNFAEARTRLTPLLGVDSYRERAQAELDRIDAIQVAQAGAGFSAAKAARRAAPASPPAAAAAPPPAAPAEGADDAR